MRKILLFLLFLMPLSAAEEDEYIVLQEKATHQGDYFAAGNTIEVSGLVQGDVYVAGSQVIIDGIVEGSVIAIGGSVEIAGTVKDNVRIVGGQIEINGEIGRNLTAMGGNIQFASRTKVGGNAVLTGGVIDVSGQIAGDLTLSASKARLLGDVGRNVTAQAGEFRVGSRVDIGGDLTYSSSSAAHLDPSARVQGKVTYEPSVISQVFEGKWKKGLFLGSRLAGILMNFTFTLLIGIIFLRLFPRKVARTIEALRKKPIKAFGVGILILILVPLVSLLLFVTILGFPIALALIALSLLGFYTAKIFPILGLTKAVLPRWNRYLAFALGLIVFLLLVRIPYFGPLLSSTFTLLGIGALFISRSGRK